MKNNKEKQQFIELRAKGLSYDRISQEIGISKPTLIKWSNQFEREINNACYLELETLVSQYGLSKKKRFESMAILMEKALEELKSRSFKNLSTKDLLSIISNMGEKISEELTLKKYITDEGVSYEDEMQESLFKKKTLPFIF